MILASASPRRRQLLERAGFSLEVRPADIDETRRAGEAPVDLVRRLATEKAHATWSSLGDCGASEPLVAADTIVWTASGEVLGKPADEDAAVRMLRELSGVVHHVTTGVCLMLPAPCTAAEAPVESSFTETTSVRFYPLTDEEIRAYVASGEPMDKAGAYGIQGAGGLFVAGIEGDWSNVVGLPVARLVRELDALLRSRGGAEKDLLFELLSRKAGDPSAL